LRSASIRLSRLVALFLALTLVAAACGDDDEDEPAATDTTAADSGSGATETETDDPAAEGGEVSGTVNVSGSSTVEPISVGVAEMFEEVEPDVVVNVDGPGTGDGFELFCNGETDISDASRPISEEEIAACEASGVEFIELKVAFDGIAVMTNPANEDVDVPHVRGPVRPRRSRGRGSHQLERRPGAGHRARLDHAAARRPARDRRPR
jgi:phosphate transport system substrate-binding protein